MSAPAPLVPLRIRLPYETESEFVARYGANLTRSGMFIATRAVKPEGMALAFEVVLKGGEALLRGEAVVTRVQEDAGPGRSGMTLSFVRLDPASREVLERLVGQRVAPAPRRLSELSRRIDAALAAEEEAVPPAEESARGPSAAGDAPPARPSTPPVRATHASPFPGDVPPQPPFPPSVESAPGSSETGDVPPARPSTPPVGATHASPFPGDVPPGPPPPPAVEPAPGSSEPGDVPAAPPPPPTAVSAPHLLEDAPPSPPPPPAVAPAPGSSEPGDVPPPPPAPPAAPAPEPAEAVDVPPPATAAPLGLSDPLTAPPLPEIPAALVEPVLGVELLGAAARVGAWSATGPTAVSLGGGAVFPMQAAFENDRWLLGRAAAARPDAIPLFAPPSAAAAPSSGDPVLTLQGHQAPARLVGAHLFSQLREEAEAALGRPARDVVLVVPSWFTYRDRLLAGEAARLGGLRPLQLLHSTSAATAAFAHDRGLARKRVLVLRAEAALFEAAIIQVTGEDLEVISTRGALPEGEAVGLDRMAEVVQEVLTAAGATPTSLDEVIRFGDPLAFSRAEPRLTELLARPLPEPLDATAAVTGAALIGHAQAALSKGKHGGTVFEVLVSPLSLVQRDGTLRRVLEVGTRLPAEKALTIPLAASELLALVFCGGAAARYEEAEVIGAANVESGPMAGELSVRLTVDRNGQLGLSTAIGGGRPEPRPLSPAIDPTALLPLTLPVEPARKAGFLRGIAQKLSKG